MVCHLLVYPLDRGTQAEMQTRFPHQESRIWVGTAVPYAEPIGIWGRRRSHFLKEYKKIEYMNLLTTGKLNAHLVEIDQQAQDMYDQLMHQMAVRAGITEQLKASDQMAWVQKMNAISNQVREIINAELIYA